MPDTTGGAGGFPHVTPAAPIDRELAAIHACVTALVLLDETAARRVLSYLRERFEQED